MSCHNIGRALNFVEMKIVELYESGCFNRETLRELLAVCWDAVGYCDGNIDEATEYLDSFYCGRCLTKRSSGEPLYTIWNTRLGWRPIQKYCDEQPVSVVGMSMCSCCFSQMLSDLGLSEVEIEQIKQNAIGTDNE